MVAAPTTRERRRRACRTALPAGLLPRYDLDFVDADVARPRDGVEDDVFWIEHTLLRAVLLGLHGRGDLARSITVTRTPWRRRPARAMTENAVAPALLVW